MRRGFSSARAVVLTAALTAGFVATVPALAGAATAAPAPPVAPAVVSPLFADGGLKAVGLTTDGWLVRFDTDAPSWLTVVGPVTGLVGDTVLVGIDYRVQNGRLYGVGNLGGVYVLNPSTGAAILVSHLTVALSGTAFGVDFNPAANRLRVISNTGQNLRHNLDDLTGTPPAGTTVADTPLTYPPLVAAATGLAGAAYTNNDLDPGTGTTLLDIDTELNRVAVQSPANAGLLVPTGQLGLDIGPRAGFDIYSELRGGRSIGSRGFATLQVGTSYRLYEIDLLSGAVIPHGVFPTGAQVFDLAIPLNQ